MTGRDFAAAFSLRKNLRSLWQRPNERYAEVDGLRALSMCWIILTHLCLGISRFMPYDAYVRTIDRMPWFHWALQGENALDSFFVISGFLIGALLLQEHQRAGQIRLPRFFARRYLRLMPAYAVALLALWGSGIEGPIKRHYIWANILYINNFLPQPHMFMDWSWSLAVEEQFYLCLPIFLWGIFFRVSRRWESLALAFLLSLAIRALVLHWHPALAQCSFSDYFIPTAPHYSSEYFDSLYVNLHTRFGAFVLGVALAWVMTSCDARAKAAWERHRQLADGLLVAAVLCLIGLTAIAAFNPHVTMPRALRWLYVWLQPVGWSVAFVVLMGTLLLSATRLNRAVGRLLAARVWYPIAQLSYCSYLFHLAFVLPGLALGHALLHPRVPFAVETSLASLGPADVVVGYAFTPSPCRSCSVPSSNLQTNDRS